MQAALESVPGVDSVNVNFSEKTAMVSCSDDVDVAALLAALEKDGFTGNVKK